MALVGSLLRAVARQIFVKNAKIVYPLLTAVPGAGVMFIEVQDYLDDLPETVFDVGTFALGAVALGGFVIEKVVKKFSTKTEG